MWEELLRRRATGSFLVPLVPSLCLGTHCCRGSASLLSSPRRQSLQDTALPGGAWEREGVNQLPTAPSCVLDLGQRGEWCALEVFEEGSAAGRDVRHLLREAVFLHRLRRLAA